MSEILTNGGFESWDAVDDPADWVQYLSYELPVREDTIVHAGNYSARTWRDGGERAGAKQSFSLEAGTTYILSFWYKSSAAYDYGLYVRLATSDNENTLNKNGTWDEGAYYADDMVYAVTTDWQYAEVEFERLGDNENYFLGFYCNNNGESVYMDDASIYYPGEITTFGAVNLRFRTKVDE